MHWQPSLKIRKGRSKMVSNLITAISGNSVWEYRWAILPVVIVVIGAIAFVAISLTKSP